MHKGQQSKDKTIKSSQKLTCLLILTYMTFQCVLPFSHFITKGYNNWTRGLYGYSWDMMVNNWATLHIKVSLKEKVSNKIIYVDPYKYASSDRWTSHADMVQQYAKCIANVHKNYTANDVEVYIDVWKSLNGRFQQRFFNPNVDILSAEWSPFQDTPWVMPLLVNMSNWRTKFNEIEDQALNINGSDVLFLADFPGCSLKNFISNDLINITIKTLVGDLRIEHKNGTVISLTTGKETQVTSGESHMVHTVSDIPSSFMYFYINQTKQNMIHYQEQYKGNVMTTFMKEKFLLLKNGFHNIFIGWSKVVLRYI